MIAYFQTLEPVDQEWPESQIGPLARVLVATGQLPYAAEEIDHNYVPQKALRLKYPPSMEIIWPPPAPAAIAQNSLAVQCPVPGLTIRPRQI